MGGRYGTRVLIVEEDGSTGSTIARTLGRAGYAVQLVSSSTPAMRWVDQLWPDCIVLDLRLEGPEGGPLLATLRDRTVVPIVLISPAADDQERVRGLELGADDFIPAPLSPSEVVARVRSVLRRVPPAPCTGVVEHLVPAGPLVLDTRTRRVRVLGVWVVLTSLEFALLIFFVRRPCETLSKAVLLEEVWGYSVGNGSTVTVHVRRLREKIEPDPARPSLIITVWGAGYRFDPSAGRAAQVQGARAV